jgi:hypothetical protein
MGLRTIDLSDSAVLRPLVFRCHGRSVNAPRLVAVWYFVGIVPRAVAYSGQSRQTRDNRDHVVGFIQLPHMLLMRMLRRELQASSSKPCR